MNRTILSLASAFLFLTVRGFGATAEPPSEFPHFQVPGHEKEMTTLRGLFWLHYPGSGPKATLWDEWLTDASLWPDAAQSDEMRRQWRDVLSARVIDAEGYVATHQHVSIAHQLGWPFPFWNQGRHGCGWHFTFKNSAMPGWRPNEISKPDGWVFAGVKDGSLAEDGWHLEITNTAAIITPPPWRCDTFEVPFLQFRWQLDGLGDCQAFIEWTTPGDTNFTEGRRMYFEPPKPGTMTYTMVPMYRHPHWTGEVAQLRIHLENSTPGHLLFQALFSQYDTRHNINGQNFVRGCAKYFWWTRDLNFLRTNIQRMRTALRYLISEYHTFERKVVLTSWVGHDGRSGLRRLPDGTKEILTGCGIGNNYWDLLPFGNLDAYASIQYYDAVRTMEALEKEIRAHPEWQIPGGFLAFDPAMLERHAADVKAEGNRLFWNPQTGRFAACVDVEGQQHDYGFTFLNCEAIYYDFATLDHAKSILSWLNGDREVTGDTARGADIYHWRFGPRATTRRNIDWYFWAWSNPESIPWGNQVQDGGAVLGFSYHDLMARLRVLGPDNARHRLQEVLRWFDEVQAAGGYRQYYNGKREGTMQGAGTPGGLGLDKEFFESALVPQVMLYGFLGFHPHADGFSLAPRLPADWPELSLDHIRFHSSLLQIRVTNKVIEIQRTGDKSEPLSVRVPAGEWEATALGPNGEALPGHDLRSRPTDSALEVSWGQADGVRLMRKDAASHQL